MALTPCRECGQQVSTEAPTCPHCGASDPAKRPKSKGLLTASSLLIALLILAGVFGSEEPKNAKSTQDAQSIATPKETKDEQPATSPPAINAPSNPLPSAPKKPAAISSGPRITAEQFREIIAPENERAFTAGEYACSPSADEPEAKVCMMKLTSGEIGAVVLVHTRPGDDDIKSVTLMNAGGPMLENDKALNMSALVLLVVARTVRAFNPELNQDRRGKFVNALIKGMNKKKNEKRVGSTLYSMNNGIFMTFAAER